MSVYAATSLTGGGSGALDAIDGTNLSEADIAIVAPALGSVSVHTLDSDSGAAESSPVTVSPDTNAGNKRWIISGLQLGGKEFVLDADGDTSITADTDDQIDFKCSNADQIVLVDGKLYPATDDDIDLGDATHEFQDAFFDGTVTTDALVADTADINGGTVDGAVIGGNSAAAITCTTLTTGGKLTAAANEVEGSNFDINGGAIDGTTFGGAANNTYSDLMPAGTVVLFGQASAPTGWTKKTDLGTDNAVLCINNQANGTALAASGTNDFQTLATHTGQSTTLTSAQSGVPAHTHAVTDVTYGTSAAITRMVASGSAAQAGTITIPANGAANAASGHTHDGLLPYFQEVICCSKD